MLIMFVVTAVETVGDTAGVVKGGLNRDATDKELSGAVVCDGVGSSIAAVFGVLPNTSFSQNVGLVGMTKVVNRFAILMGALILVISGLFPKVGAIISIMPQPVLGGAAVMMFASIVVSGINLLTEEPRSTPASAARRHWLRRPPAIPWHSWPPSWAWATALVLLQRCRALCPSG